MKIIDQILDLVFPTTCHGCGAPGGDALCRRCVAELAISGSGEEVPSPLDRTACGQMPLMFNGFRSGGLYEGLLREAVLELKSSRRLFAFPLALLMAAAAGNDPDYIAPDAVCFVPSTRRKNSERGYNPAQLLALKLSGLTGIPLVACLRKTRETEDQDSLTRAGRLSNVKGVFSASAPAVSGNRMLLIDDVLTTGATAGACSEALLSAGASSVHVLVAAEAVHRGWN